MADNIFQRVIDIARGQNGYVEKKSNITKYASEIYPSVQGAAWCGVFDAWCYKQAGVDLRPWCWMPFVPSIEAWAKKIGAWRTDHAEMADLVVYGFGRSSGQHTGIAWPDKGAAGYRAIEGNTSASSAGSQANGGQVAIRYRGRSSIRGWVRMSAVLAHYGVSTGAGAPVTGSGTSGLLTVDGINGKGTAREMQERLKLTVPSIVVDSVFGPASARALQTYLHTKADGVISGQNAYCRTKNPSIRKDVMQLGNRGSNMVVALQKYAGVKSRDGLWGDGLNLQLQVMMNGYTAFLTPEDNGIKDQRLNGA